MGKISKEEKQLLEMEYEMLGHMFNTRPGWIRKFTACLKQIKDGKLFLALFDESEHDRDEDELWNKYCHSRWMAEKEGMDITEEINVLIQTIEEHEKENE